MGIAGRFLRVIVGIDGRFLRVIVDTVERRSGVLSEGVLSHVEKTEE